jgi:hypothetical protein
MKLKLPPKFVVHYFGRVVQFEKKSIEEKHDSIQIGKVMLTRSGEELAMICGAQFDGDIMEHCINFWNNNHWNVAEVK